MSASAASFTENDFASSAATAGKITLSKTSLTVARGNTASLAVRFSDGIKTDVTWSSSNKTVCTVKDGVITARSAGTAIIKAKTSDGRTAKCTVTVVVKPTKIVLNKSSVNIYRNSTLTLKATVYPSSTTNKTVKWKSSKPDIASVSQDGVITGISKGKATITAIASNGIKTTAIVNVIVPASGISLKKSTALIGVGEEFKPTVSLTPSASNEIVTFTSDNPKVAAVVNGKIKGKAPGKAVIKATIPNGKLALCTVTVQKAPEWVQIRETNLELGAGETYSPDIMIPNDRACSKFTYTSTDTSVFTVSALGKLTAKKAGLAFLTAETYNGKSSSASVKVYNAPTSIRLSTTSKTLKPQQTLSLNVIFNSGEKSNKLKFTSSNTAVCTVEKNGTVTAKSAGTAVITARTFNGKTASCKVTVQAGISDSEFRSNFNTFKNYILSHYEGTDDNGNKYIRFAHPGATEENGTYVVFTYAASQNVINIEDCTIDEQFNIFVTRFVLDYNTPSKVSSEVLLVNLFEAFTNPISYLGKATIKPAEYTRTTKLKYTFSTDGTGTVNQTVYSDFKQKADSLISSSLLFADSKLKASGSGMTLAKLGFISLK